MSTHSDAHTRRAKSGQSANSPRNTTRMPAWSTYREQGIESLQAGELNRAVSTLKRARTGDKSGESDALLGLAYYRSEGYEAATKYFHLALERDPDNAQWRDMCEKAAANVLSEVQIAVPEVAFLDRDALLAPPTIGDGTLPAPRAPLDPLPARRVLLAIGNGSGWLISWATELLTEIGGRMAGYHDRVWTNWYRRKLTFAILTLAYMRNKLNRDNLKDTYPPGVLTGFQPRGQPPPTGVRQFRTANGSWNNLVDPMEGAAGTRFGRNVGIEAIRPEGGDALMDPNPRLVSLKLLTRDGPMKEVPFLNLLAASWIQFQNHDWVSHGENLATPDIYELELPEDDPAREKYRQTKMFVGRTQPDPTRMPSGESTPLTYINEVTHWWDGSQIYGSDQETVDRLRSYSHGKMRLGPDGGLPLGPRAVEDTGFNRNWWVGLSMLHTLFVKEHNAICDRLRTKYPHWEDRRLFNVARLINAAVMAKIHTVEWTPAILPNPAANLALNANWFGLAANMLRRNQDRKTVSSINIRHPEVGGVVGNPSEKHDVPYSLSEEFVEVYRLHSLLPERLVLKSHSNTELIEEVGLASSRQAGSAKLTQRVSMPDLFYSFGNQHPGQLVLNNFPKFLQELSIPGNPLLDLGAVDILRARERGVPRYNEFRRQLGLNPIERVEDLTDDPQQVAKIKAVYGDRPQDVETIDLLIGTLAEGHRPSGFGFGETLFQIFILNATRRLQADRFYTDCYDETTYTREGLAWIDDATLKTVILRHHPELAATGLANVTNAFEPWDTCDVLDLDRHPLRRYNRDLGPNPARGDAYFQP